jgi:DNA (cytosine-5)-methyltransferase 1
MKHLELFAGIGGFRRAMDLLSGDGVLNFESVGFSEIDKNASLTYTCNYHPSEEEIVMGDIVNFTSNPERISSLPDFDILTGGFPCQTFSMMGNKEGFNEDRGQMFFRIIDILTVKRPKYVLLENVKNLVTHDHGKTYIKIKSELEALGYNVYARVFNTSDFHLPQNRSRVLIFATITELTKEEEDNYSSNSVKELFDQVYKEKGISAYETVIDVLAKTVPNKYYLSDKIKPTILADGSANFRSKSEINQLIARPLTATMHKMHRACQDNYYSQVFIDSNGVTNEADVVSKVELCTRPIRRITPEEAFMLQGFPAEFATNARKHGVADGSLYKQAGNAVSVNTIYAVLYYLISNGHLK